MTIDPRLRNLAIAAIAPAIIVVLVARASEPKPPADVAPISTAPDPMTVVPTAGPQPTVGSQPAAAYSYAIETMEIEGVPPDLPEGTPVEIWVTWQEGSRVGRPQPWITDAIFERVSPAVTPTGSDVVVVTIPKEQRRKMAWASHFAKMTLFAKAEG